MRKANTCKVVEMSVYGSVSLLDPTVDEEADRGQNTLAVKDNSNISRTVKPLACSVAATLLLLGGLLLAVFISSIRVHTHHTILDEEQVRSDKLKLPSLSVDVSNKYSSMGKDYKRNYPYLQNSEILEPHIASYLSIAETVDGAVYEWNINEFELNGSQSIQYTCTTPGTLFVIVSEMINGMDTRRYAGTWHCKYVRREIRSLLDEDREAYFVAVETLHNVDQGVGTLLFGKDYISMENLVKMHNELAGDKMCDHAHDGRGFLVTHSALTNLFEKSIQAVNPLLAVPYWDFTIEQSSANLHGDMSYWYDSVVFSEDWFGEVPSEGFILSSGRFSKTRIPTVKSDGDVRNPYGLMRAPWNANKHPYITRSRTMMGFQLKAGPSCSDHFSLLSCNSWVKFSGVVAYGPHGPVHILLGGIWGANYSDLFQAIQYDPDNAYTVAVNGFALQKNMWREGLYVCPETCDTEDDVDQCKCTCPELSSWDSDTLDSTLGLVDFFMDEHMKRDVHGRDVRYEILKIICNDYPGVTTIIGDQLESASPVDVSFWSMHPTMERLWQWKMLNGGFDDDEWPYDETQCEGHNPDDLQPFLNVFGDQPNPLSNSELMQLLHPSNEDLPYVYDGFTWAHCVAEGFDSHLRGMWA